jgi:hypothetical protein
MVLTDLYKMCPFYTDDNCNSPDEELGYTNDACPDCIHITLFYGMSDEEVIAFNLETVTKH